MRASNYSLYRTKIELDQYRMPKLEVEEYLGICKATVVVKDQNLTEDIRYIDYTHTVIVPKVSDFDLKIGDILEEYGEFDIPNPLRYRIIEKWEYGTMFKSYLAKCV